MLKYATIKIGFTGNMSYKKKFNEYKKPLASKVAFLKNKQVTFAVSNFDCDYTYKIDNCVISTVLIENVIFYLEICKENNDYCKITIK